jgi:hypothetical protein
MNPGKTSSLIRETRSIRRKTLTKTITLKPLKISLILAKKKESLSKET